MQERVVESFWFFGLGSAHSLGSAYEAIHDISVVAHVPKEHVVIRREHALRSPHFWPNTRPPLGGVERRHGGIPGHAVLKLCAVQNNTHAKNRRV